jgi:hypothetical protein
LIGTVETAVTAIQLQRPLWRQIYAQANLKPGVIVCIAIVIQQGPLNHGADIKRTRVIGCKTRICRPQREQRRAKQKSLHKALLNAYWRKANIVLLG